MAPCGPCGSGAPGPQAAATALHPRRWDGGATVRLTSSSRVPSASIPCSLSAVRSWSVSRADSSATSSSIGTAGPSLLAPQGTTERAAVLPKGPRPGLRPERVPPAETAAGTSEWALPRRRSGGRSSVRLSMAGEREQSRNREDRPLDGRPAPRPAAHEANGCKPWPEARVAAKAAALAPASPAARRSAPRASSERAFRSAKLRMQWSGSALPAKGEPAGSRVPSIVPWCCARARARPGPAARSCCCPLSRCCGTSNLRVRPAPVARAQRRLAPLPPAPAAPTMPSIAQRVRAAALAVHRHVPLGPRTAGTARCNSLTCGLLPPRFRRDPARPSFAGRTSSPWASKRPAPGSSA